MTTDILAWLGLLLTMFFGMLSLFFYFSGRRLKRIACLITSATLQKRVHPDVQIWFRGQEVADLSRMVIYFWNAGTEEIRRADVPADHWPRLTFPEGARVFSVAPLTVSTDHIQLRPVQPDTRSVAVEFKYLNSGDGAILEILFEASQATGGTSFAAPLVGGRSPDFGDLPVGFGKEVWLSVEESTGGLIGGFALSVSFTDAAGGSNRGLVGAIGIGVGLLVSVGAFYLDHRRLHRRLPGFARRYLEGLAAA